MSINEFSRKTMVRLGFSTSLTHASRVKTYADRLGLPFHRLICIAIDNELEKENPFEYNLKLPCEDEFIDNEYDDEGGKFLKYLELFKGGMGLETIVHHRYDMGITDKKALLTVFADCLHHQFIEAIPAKSKQGKTFPEGYTYYRLKEDKTKKSSNKRSKEISEYDLYLKLNKKYGSEA